MYKISGTIERKRTGIVKKQPTADPERRLTAEIDRMRLLEQFPEIKDTGKYNQQRSQCPRHRMKSPHALDEKHIHQKQRRINEQQYQQNFSHPPVLNDPVKQI